MNLLNVLKRYTTHMRNTKEKGTIEFFSYQEDSKYVAVCLTFDIVEEGESLRDVQNAVVEAAKLHLETVVAHNLSDDLLNRTAPEEYLNKYNEALRKLQTSSIPSPVSVQTSPYSHGQFVYA